MRGDLRGLKRALKAVKGAYRSASNFQNPAWQEGKDDCIRTLEDVITRATRDENRPILVWGKPNNRKEKK